MATFNKTDIDLIRKFEEIKNKGYYASGSEVTNVYNRVFGTTLSSTSCSSCIRGRIQQMVDALNRFEATLKAQEATKVEEPINTTAEENNATQPKIKRVGRKKK